MSPHIHSFFHAPTNSFSHVVFDRRGGDAIIIDPVLDFDPRTGRTSVEFAAQLISFVRDQALTVHWLLETHTHADHVTAAHPLSQTLGCGTAIGARAHEIQHLFADIFGLDGDAPRHFDWLLQEGDEFAFGGLLGRALCTPGHTVDGMTYLIGDCAFIGDLLFMPDCGTGRCDFPGGDAPALYRSIQRVLSLPATTRILLCHDYPTAREPACETTVAEQRRSNIHLVAHPHAEDFVAFRRERDRKLQLPALMIPAIQLNRLAGALPPPAPDGRRYLKLPLNVL